MNTNVYMNDMDTEMDKDGELFGLEHGHGDGIGHGCKYEHEHELKNGH